MKGTHGRLIRLPFASLIEIPLPACELNEEKINLKISSPKMIKQRLPVTSATMTGIMHRVHCQRPHSKMEIPIFVAPHHRATNQQHCALEIIHLTGEIPVTLLS